MTAIEMSTRWAKRSACALVIAVTPAAKQGLEVGERGSYAALRLQRSFGGDIAGGGLAECRRSNDLDHSIARATPADLFATLYPAILGVVTSRLGNVEASPLGAGGV